MKEQSVNEAYSRTVATTGIHNFRDYGDYPIVGGGRLVRGRLFRSGEPAKATNDDLNLVSGLGLSGAIDLRGLSERTKAPSRFPADFHGVIVAYDGETAEFAPHTEAAAKAIEGVDARKTFQERYRTLPFRTGIIDVFSRYFQLLSATSAPTVVFCSAGKDRTGVLVALLHSVMGVHRDDIVEDYLLTNTAGDTAGRIAALRNDLEKRFGSGLSDEAIRIIVSVEESFLDAAINAIIERNGSIQNYLTDVLSITPVQIDALKVKLTC